MISRVAALLRGAVATVMGWLRPLLPWLLPVVRVVAWVWPIVAFLGGAIYVVQLVATDAFGVPSASLSDGSDYWEHAAVMRALLEHPFAPASPHLPVDGPSPRFSPHALVVIALARVSGADAFGAVAINGVLNVVLLMAGLLAFPWVYFKDRRASLLALVVFPCSWWEGWHFSNVYQLELLPTVAAYPSTGAVATTLLGLTVGTLAHRAISHRAWIGWLVATGLATTYTMLLHPLTAMVLLVGVSALAVFEPGPSRRRRVVFLAVVGVAVLLSAVWPYFSAIEVVLGGKGEHDWTGKFVTNVAKGRQIRRLHKFYDVRPIMKNLGLALVAVHLASVAIARRRWAWLGLTTWVLVLPFLVNVFYKLPLGHRFILLAMVPMHLLVVGTLLSLLPRAPESWSGLLTRTGTQRRWLARLLVVPVAALLAVFVWHNVHLAERARTQFVRQWRRKVVPAHVRLARDVARRTPKRAVVLAPTRMAWSFPALGRRVVAALHGNPLVPSDGNRRRAVARFFKGQGSDRFREEVLRRYQVTHVVLARRTQHRVRRLVERHATKGKGGKARSTRLYGGARLYQLDLPVELSPKERRKKRRRKKPRRARKGRPRDAALPAPEGSASAPGAPSSTGP